MVNNICQNCMYYDKTNIEETKTAKSDFEYNDTEKGSYILNSIESIVYNLEWDYFKDKESK